MQAPHDRYPPYCCCILHEGEGTGGSVLLEQRGADAKVAAGKLTCFGGKREAGEPPLTCIVRELREELGLEAAALPEAVDAAAEAAGGAKRARRGAVRLAGALRRAV